MSATILEARAVITAEDQTGPVLAKIKRHLDDLSRASKASTGQMRAVRDIERVTASQRRMVSEHLSAQRALVGVAGAFAAHKAAHFARESLHTYREFDKERRYAKAVMGISDAQQKPLIDQAIHGGATSKFNDIQWLEAQRELAARGLNVDQVKALAEVASTIGQAMDKSLPESVKLLEGAMFGFSKDTSTFASTLAGAQRTADLQVKASKISGMSAEDIQQAYKYAATPFRMAGLTEEQLLAFAATGKKANMGGDEMGTAGRALVAAILNPTRGARTAMLAAGIDYSRFQTVGAKPMDVDMFAKSIAQSYGVELSKQAKAQIGSVFSNRALVSDAAKFAPAIMKVLGEALGGSDAKSKKAIAQEARRYRDASMSGVDSQALLNAMIPAMVNSPSLANAILGSKHGGRIKTALGEVFLQKLEELTHHSGGYAKEVSDARMAGFDGAMSRLEGAVKNVETAFGRAFDNDGRGGFLTYHTGAIASAIQSIAELPPHLFALGTAATAAAAAFAGFKGVETLVSGFGLKGSAVALTEAAHALSAAAGRQAGGGVTGAAAATGGGLVSGALAVGGGALTAAMALGYFVGGKWRPEAEVRTKSEMAQLNKEISMIEGNIAAAEGRGGDSSGSRARLVERQIRLGLLRRRLAHIEAGDAPTDDMPIAPPNFGNVPLPPSRPRGFGTGKDLNAVPWAGGLKAVVEGPIAVSGEATVKAQVDVNAASSLIEAAATAKNSRMSIQSAPTGRSMTQAEPNTGSQ